MPQDASRPGALHGLRVLDFTALLQGPLATQILADLGADVVKLEKPDGEWMRAWGIFASRTHGETDAFLAFNRNKRSVAVDLRDGEDVQRVLELADRADVVVENFRPGVMDRLGLGYEALAKRNPRLIYAASSGYGRTGPYVSKPGQDYLVQALTGATWLSGRREDPPFLMALAIADQYTGIHLVVGILAALQHRARTGEGQRVDVDLLSCMLALQQQELTVYLNHHNSFERASGNLGHPGLPGPTGIYPTADGYLMLAMTPCPKLGGILGVGWLDEFDTLEKMFDARDTVYERLAAHFRTQATAHWIGILSAADVWCAPVQKYEDLERDPQIAHKRLFWDVPYADGEKTYRTVGSPFSFSESPASVRRGAPRAGQHTAEFRDGTIWKE